VSISGLVMSPVQNYDGSYLTPAKRQFLRLKITITSQHLVDVNRNALPDAWEIFYFGGLGRVTANSTICKLDGLTALDAYLHGLNPKKSLASQTAENYTYDARAWLRTIDTPVLTATLTLDSEGNIESAQTTTTQ